VDGAGVVPALGGGLVDRTGGRPEGELAPPAWLVVDGRENDPVEDPESLGGGPEESVVGCADACGVA